MEILDDYLRTFLMDLQNRTNRMFIFFDGTE